MNKVITKDHSIIEGTYCTVRGDHNIITGSNVIIKGDHNKINVSTSNIMGDFNNITAINTVVNGDYNNILDGLNITVEGDYNNVNKNITGLKICGGYMNNMNNTYINKYSSNNNPTKIDGNHFHVSTGFDTNSIHSVTQSFNHNGINNTNIVYNQGDGRNNVNVNTNVILNHGKGNNDNYGIMCNKLTGKIITNQNNVSVNYNTDIKKNPLEKKKELLEDLKSNKNRDEKAKEEKDACCICLENLKKVTLLKCGHLCCCISCTISIFDNVKPICPICREEIKKCFINNIV